MKIRTADALSLFNSNHAALARVFDPPLSRYAVHQWGEYLPELRARQLVERHPAAAAYVEGPDGVTPAARAAAEILAKTSQQGGVGQVERSIATEEDSRG